MDEKRYGLYQQRIGADADMDARAMHPPPMPPTIPQASQNALYDRFLPNRTAMDLDAARFQVKGGLGPDAAEPATGDGLLAKPAGEQAAFQEQVARACGIELDGRILAYAPPPPSRDAEDAVPTATWDRARAGAGGSALGRRPVSSEAAKVLDAPGLVDDYYLNVLDWSRLGTLGVVLGDAVFLWEAQSGQVAQLCTAAAGQSFASLSFSRDGHFVALGTAAGDVQIWDVAQRKRLRTMRGHVTRVGVLAWDVHTVASGSRSGAIWQHDVRLPEHKILEMHAHVSEVCGLEWRLDGQMLASGGNDNAVHIWDARAAQPLFSKTEHKSAVKAVAWCPWQTGLLATGGGAQDRMVHFWNTSTGHLLSSIETPSQVTSIRWSRHYKELLTTHGYPDNHLALWQFPSLRKVADLSGHDARVLYSSVSPDGETVVTGAPDHTLKFWHVWEPRARGGAKGGSGAPVGDATGKKGASGAFSGRMSIR